MASGVDVVRCYAQLAATVERMLEHARARRWADLPALDEECTQLVDRLRTMAPQPDLDPAQRARAAALIDRIRADQDEIGSLIRPQFTRLARRIEHLLRGQKARSAYRAG